MPIMFEDSRVVWALIAHRSLYLGLYFSLAITFSTLHELDVLECTHIQEQEYILKTNLGVTQAPNIYMVC